MPGEALIVTTAAAEVWRTADQLIRRYGDEAADIATLRAIGLGADRYSRHWFDVARAIREFWRCSHWQEETVN
jgi:hypothetical protein